MCDVSTEVSGDQTLKQKNIYNSYVRYSWNLENIIYWCSAAICSQYVIYFGTVLTTQLSTIIFGIIDNKKYIIFYVFLVQGETGEPGPQGPKGPDGVGGRVGEKGEKGEQVRM